MELSCYVIVRKMLEVGWLNIGFIILTILELTYFWIVSGRQNIILIVATCWLVAQAIIALTGFYQVTDVMPPRLLLVFIPVIFAVFYFGLSQKAAAFRSRFNLKALHFIHLVRVPVEVFFLYGLHELGYIAEEVTFEGNNFDIIPGITMPIFALLYWRYEVISKTFLIIWNLLCFSVLIFTISQAVLSAPFPFQILSFDEPTVAVLYFPFIWLPALVAPMVLLSHLISIKELINYKN